MTIAPRAPRADAETSARSEHRGAFTTQADSRLSLSPLARARTTAIVFWGNLVCQMGIILTGGAVRLTGSGLGCSQWPNCEPGRFTPELTLESGLHPFIEFGNRTLTGVLGVFSIAVLVIALRWLGHKGRGFRRLAWIPFLGTVLQAVIGKFVVELDLHPGLVSPHFLISPVIVAVSAVLVFRLYHGDGAPRLLVPRPMVALYVAFAAVGFVVLVLGTVVTGTGPHSGDSTLIYRFPIDPRMISWLHADAVMLFTGLLLGLLIALYAVRAPRPPRTAALALVALSIAQAVIGYAQYFTGLPELLVALHLLGAALFAGGIAWLGAALWTWSPAEPVADLLVLDEAAAERRVAPADAAPAASNATARPAPSSEEPRP